MSYLNYFLCRSSLGLLILSLFIIFSCSSKTADSSGTGDDIDTDEDTTGNTAFNLSDAVAIVKVNGTWESTNTLMSTRQATVGNGEYKKLKSDGSIEEIGTGASSINAVQISPDGYVYFIMSSSTSVETSSGTVSCILLKLGDAGTECVDDSLVNLESATASMNTVSFESPRIQFDNAGAVYYFGRNSEGKFVIRKKASDGVFTDYLNTTSSDIAIYQFVVAEDGYIYIAGQTTTTNQYWVRSISPSSTLSNLTGTANATEWMHKFPDGNIYVGSWNFSSPAYLGVYTIDTTTHALQNKCWVSLSSGSSNNCDVTGPLSYEAAHYDADTLCTNAGLGSGCLETMLVSNFFQTPSDIVYARIGDLQKRLWKVYPSVEYVPLTNITNVSAVDGSLGYLVLGGVNGSDVNKFILFNLTDNSEIDLSPSEEIEIYHAQFSGDGKIWFDGLRFSDNKYIVGVVDTTIGNQMTILANQTQKLDDFIVLK